MKTLIQFVCLSIFVGFFGGCTVSNPEVIPDIPLYKWDNVGAFNGRTIQHIDVTENGEILLSTDNKIYISDNGGKFFYSISIPDSVDVYKVRKYENDFYLVGEMYSPTAGGFWGGTIRLLYKKQEGENNWVKIHGGYLFQDVLVKSNKFYVGALNGVTVVGDDFSVIERFQLFNSKLNDQVDDMIEFEDYLLFSCHEGIYGSNDQGNTWNDITARLGKEHDHILKMDIDADGTLHAMASHRIYVTSSDSFEWKIRYLPENYDRITMVSSDEYAAIEYKRVYHIEVNENGDGIPYRITPETHREVEYLRWDHIQALPNGDLILAGNAGVYIGTRNPESENWY